MTNSTLTTRRGWLRNSFLLGTAPLVQTTALATPQEMAAAMHKVYGDRTITAGRVELALPALAENGNSVRMQVNVESPMTDTDHVRSIQVFAEANPLPDIVRFELSPLSGQARVETRIRVAAEQFITAVAEMSDGSLWSGNAHIVVTEAACLDALI